MQCINKVKQLTLALHTYHDNQKMLPINGSDLRDVPNWASAFVRLLPYIELVTIYEGFVDGTPYHANPYSGVFSAVTDEACVGPIDAFNCPSDSQRVYWGNDRKAASTNYVVSYGDSTRGTPLVPLPVPPQRGLFNGQNCEWRVDAGVYTKLAAPNVGLEFSAITDGTSNTVAISETLVVKSTNDDRIGAGLAQVAGGSYTAFTGTNAPGTAPGYPQYIRKPGVVAGFRGPDNKLISPHTAVTGGRGATFAMGAAVYTGFTTILPPNSPSGTYYGGSPHDYAGVMSAASSHAGGVNVSFVDGSAVFVTETVNALSDGQVLADADDPETGPSPFGIWGALGSIDGGESVTLP